MKAIANSGYVLGSNLLKAGWSFDKSPRLIVPPVMSRYRDRKLNRACQFIGYDSYVDATTRGQLRNAFDPGTSVVGNWDVMEGLLDYTFIKLGVDGASGGIDRSVVMTEPIANLGYPRKSGFLFLLVDYIQMVVCDMLTSDGWISSDERDSLRMLLRTVRRLWSRFTFLLPL